MRCLPTGDAALPPAPAPAAPACPFPPPLQPWREAGLGRVGKGGEGAGGLANSPLPGQGVGACALHIPSTLVPGCQERVDARGQVCCEMVQEGRERPSNPTKTSLPHCCSSLRPADEPGDPLHAHSPASPPTGGHFIPHLPEPGGRGSQGTSSTIQLISQEDI